MVQVPKGAAGAAAGVLVWSWCCLLSNCLFIWLLWGARERRSFIFIISCVTLLATVTSIISQVNDILYYENIMWRRLRLAQDAASSPASAASNGAVGIDLVMWAMRWGCYVAESGLACFWAFSLTQAVYGWRDDIRFRRPLLLISELGKPFSLLAALVSMCVLWIGELQKCYFWWNFVLNFFYCAFLLGGLFMFFLILIEFFKTRLLFRRMNSQQRHEYVWQPSDTSSSHARSDSVATSMANISDARGEPGSPFGALQQRQGGIYDKYLMLRTFIPLLALALFEVDNILTNKSQYAKMQRLAATSAPDLSAAAARHWFTSYMPGCLASLILPLAFATTRSLSGRVRRVLAPARRLSLLLGPLGCGRKQGCGGGGPRRPSCAEVVTYVAMDSDNGILSRQRRLLMEERLQIEVTYEFEVRSDPPASGDPGKSDVSAGSTTYPYNVENHRWNDTEVMLPKRPPSVTALRRPRDKEPASEAE